MVSGFSWVAKMLLVNVNNNFYVQKEIEKRFLFSNVLFCFVFLSVGVCISKHRLAFQTKKQTICFNGPRFIEWAFKMFMVMLCLLNSWLKGYDSKR